MKNFVAQLIKDMEEEFKNSPDTEFIYNCEDRTEIHTDVCCIKEWFDQYKEVMKKRYKRNSDDFEFPLNDECKHFTPRLNTIRELIACLYNLEGCGCGGLAHIVVDDNNIDDGSLQCVIDLCNEEENKDEEEAGLAKLICEEMLK